MQKNSAMFVDPEVNRKNCQFEFLQILASGEAHAQVREMAN